MSQQTFTCSRCGASFGTYYAAREKFCSLACRKAATVELHTTNCAHCGVVFVASSSSAGKYCSHDCYAQSIKGKHPYNYDPIVVACEYCGEPFEIEMGRLGKARYCSRKCHGKSKTTNDKRTCVQCGKPFKVWAPRKHSAKFCSHKCQGRFYSGTNSPFWVGGIRRYYYGPNWREQQLATRLRDGDQCQACGVRRGKLKYELHVHHIKPFRLFKGDYARANHLSNLISLCRSCHRKAERGKVPIQSKLIHDLT